MYVEYAKTIPLFFRVVSIDNMLNTTLNSQKTRQVTLSFIFHPTTNYISTIIFAHF